MPQETIDPKKPPEKAVLAAALLRDDPRRELEKPLDELASLADTAEIVVAGEVIQKRDKPEPATFVGKGTVERIKQVVAETGADCAIFDNELSPGQVRNLEKVI